MTDNNICYFAVIQDQSQAVELSISDLENNDPDCLAIYRVDFDINDMPLEDVLIYLPAYHNSPASLIRKSGISLYSGTMNI